MAHGETALLTSVTISLAFAFAAGLAAHRLGQSPILGYLLAGIAVGPFTPGFIADPALAAQLADIGLILLLFGVGIHFSVRDLLAVRGVAVAGTVAQTTILTAAAAYAAAFAGWDLPAGLVLGLALSIASTVVAFRALNDRGQLDSAHGRITAGWLISEDLLTVLALVLIPPLMTTDPRAVVLPVLETLAKLVAFAVLVAFVGARAVPWLLAVVARTGARELFTLGVLALALGVALGATALFGISLAVGAFVAGVVVGESDLAHQAAADALPLRDAFAVLFFVSAGMLFDPAILVTSPGALFTALTAVFILKPLLALLIVLVVGYPVRVALPVAAARAQIGEFSFVLGGVGLQLGLLPADGYGLVITTAILSIGLNPLAFRAAEALAPQLSNWAPLTALVRWRAGALARLPLTSDSTEPRGHAILCGHGRVGSIIARALSRRGFRYVVIEQDRRIVEELRHRGVSAIYGDASNPALLEHAGLATARILLAAIPDPASVRLIVDHTRRVNPGLDIVARTHSEAEWTYLQGDLVNEAVLGERELAIEMARHALQRFGVSAAETLVITQGLRHGD